MFYPRLKENGILSLMVSWVAHNRPISLFGKEGKLSCQMQICEGQPVKSTFMKKKKYWSRGPPGPVF